MELKWPGYSKAFKGGYYILLDKIPRNKYREPNVLFLWILNVLTGTALGLLLIYLTR